MTHRTKYVEKTPGIELFKITISEKIFTIEFQIRIKRILTQLPNNSPISEKVGNKGLSVCLSVSPHYNRIVHSFVVVLYNDKQLGIIITYGMVNFSIEMEIPGSMLFFRLCLSKERFKENIKLRLEKIW